MGHVVIIGSSNMDLNVYSERLPNRGETVTGGTFRQSLGGKGANQSVASARSGAKTIFISRIGRDAFGDQMKNQLEREGIDTSRIIRDPQEASGIAFILIDKNGDNMISVAPGANAKLSTEDITNNSEIIESASSIIVQMEIPIETIEVIFKIASKGNAIKILNPAPLKQIPPKILKNIDIIVPNEGELFRLNSLLNNPELTGAKQQKIIQASKAIAEFGLKYVITTLGSDGCLIYDSLKKEVNIIPAFKVNAVDSVGAGDCFIGVIASKLSKGLNIVDAAKYATAAASIAVTRKGAQDSLPSIEEIEAQYKKFDKILKI